VKEKKETALTKKGEGRYSDGRTGDIRAIQIFKTKNKTKIKKRKKEKKRKTGVQCPYRA